PPLFYTLSLHDALPILVRQRFRVTALPVGSHPEVDRLARHAQFAGDVGGGAAVIVFQDSQDSPEQECIPCLVEFPPQAVPLPGRDRKSTRLNSSHLVIS